MVIAATRTVWAPLALSLLLILSGCANGGGGGTTDTGAGGTSTTGTDTGAGGTDAGGTGGTGSGASIPSPCTLDFPQPLELLHETQAERDAGEGLSACGSADGAGTLIVNTSAFIWLMPDFEWMTENTEQQELQVRAFRQAISEMNGGLALQPGASVSLSEVRPEDVYITVDESAQAAWAAVSAAAFLAEEKMGSALSSRWAGSDKAKTALASCGLAVYGAGKAVQESVDPQTAFDAWLGAIGTGAGAITCTTATDELVASRAQAAPVTTADELLEIAQRPMFARSAGKTLHTSAVARSAIATRKIFTRGR